MRIAVVAPSSRFDEEAAARVAAIAARVQPGVALHFHPQCFLTHNHFAGTDAAREDALVEVANDPGVDAIWFARGGYGACRIAEAALARLGPAARAKAWLGYSDAGFLLAGLYRAGFAQVAHGPMPQDVMREGGEAAVERALAWLAGRARRRARARPGERPAPRRLQPHRALACCSAPRSSPICPATSCCSRRCRSICMRSTGRCSTSPPAPPSSASPGSGSGARSTSSPTIPISARRADDRQTLVRTLRHRLARARRHRPRLGQQSGAFRPLRRPLGRSIHRKAVNAGEKRGVRPLRPLPSGGNCALYPPA